MMLRSMFLKGVRDRWRGALIAAASLIATAVLGLWAYAGIGDDAVGFFNDMPEAYLSLLGIPADGSLASLMFAQVNNFLGPLVLAGIAVSMGAASFAGEERQGTMNVLATVPRSRTRLLASTGLAAAAVTVGATALVWLGNLAALWVTDTSGAGLHLGAAAVHLGALAVWFGALAFAVGAWTGHQQLASAVATAMVVVSFLGAGLLPLVDEVADLARVFPWYYLGAHSPMINGVHWGDLAVLLGGAAVLIVLAFVGVRRRDLRSGEAGSAAVVERLRAHPLAARALDILGGGAATRGVTAKTLAEGRGIASIAAFGLLFMLVIMGPMYRAIEDSVGDLVSALPEEILAMVGFTDYSTGAGWYHGESLTIVVPVALLVTTISMAVRSLAGEERTRTAQVLFTQPVSRRAVAWRKAAAMLAMGLGVGVMIVVGIGAGNVLAGLDMSWWHIVQTAIVMTALGWVFGAIAFAAGAATGRTQVAMGVAVGCAIAAWAVNAFHAVNSALEPFARFSPFYYALDSYPLANGVPWWHVAVLVAATGLLLAGGVWAFTRRDLRA